MPATCARLPTTPISSVLRFQYVDEPLTGRTLDGENAHIGFVTVADLPYENLIGSAMDANLSVLRQLQRNPGHGAGE